MEIISIGRYDLLIEVLNGLAMLTSDAGPAGYGGMVALGLIVGVVITLARGIVTQKLELQWVLAGWLLYACLFVPKVTVTVRDVYTGATNAVDNVPLGPAAIGAVTSQVGVVLADAFGSVFSYPSLTSTGYLDTLDLIDSFNKMDYGDANDARIGNRGRGLGGDVSTIDVQRSLNNYLADCTLYAMTMNLPGTAVSWSGLREANDLLTAIRVDSNTWFATMYLSDGAPNGTVVNCTDAYAALADFIRARFVPAWEQEIAKKLKLSDPPVQIQSAVDSLFGVGKDRQIFMTNVLIKKQLELSELGYQAKTNNTAGLIMRTQAMEQRRVQWASEQSLFQEMARPLMGYVEAFFYAVSPIMAFTFLLGAVGITLFGRYLLLAIWIQLWMPIMAINNLYVSMAAADRIQSIGTGGFDVMSIVGLDSVWTQTQSWLATGGMMAGATPLLALMLVTGSYFAFTSLTNRMAAGDHINEKIAAPDIMQPAAFASVGAMGMQQPQFTNTPLQGTHTTGALDLIPQINVSRGLSSTLQSKESYAEDASQRFLHDISAGGSLSRTKDMAAFVQNYTSHQGTSRASRADQLLESTGRSIMNDDQRYNSMTTSERASFDGAVSLGLMGLGSGGKVGGLLQHVKENQEGERKTWAEKIEKLSTHGNSRTVDFTRAIATDEQEGVRGQFVNALGVRDENKWSEATAATLQTIKSYDEVDSLTQVRGMQQNINTLTVAHMAQQGGWFGELVGLASKHNLYNDKMQEEVAQFRQGLGDKAKFYGIDEKTAFGIKLTQALGEGSSNEQADLAKLLNDHGFFTTNAVPGDPHHNSGLKPKEGEFPTAASIRADVDSHLPEGPVNTTGVAAMVDGKVHDAGVPGSAELRDRGEAAVRQFFDAEMTGNEQAKESAMREMERVATLEKKHLAESKWQETRTLMTTLSETNLSAKLKSFFSSDFKEKQYQEAYQYAQEKHLPEPAARYLATLAALPYGEKENLQKALLGQNEEVNRLREQVSAQFTPLGAQMLGRAALSDHDSRERYVNDALSLYEAKQLKPRPKHAGAME